MSTPKERLSNLKIKEVSLVDSGDNPPARAVLFKRRALGKRVRDGESHLRGLVRKQTFDEEFDEAMLRQSYHVIMGRVDMLIDAIWDSIFHDDEMLVSGDLESEIRTSIEQFASRTTDDLDGIMSGIIMKRFDGQNCEALDEKFTAAVGEIVAKVAMGPPESSAPSAEKGKIMKGIDLSKLDDETRAKVEEQLAKAEKVDVLESEVNDLKKAAEAKPDPEKVEKTEPKTEPKSEPADVVKRVDFEKEVAEKTALAKRVDELEKREQRREFEKTLDLTGVPGDHEKLTETLFKMAPEDRQPLIDSLTTAGAAIEKGRRDGYSIFSEAGSGHADDGGQSAGSELAKRAAALRKSRPELTIEQASAEVLTEHPELYETYLMEHDAQTRPN